MTSIGENIAPHILLPRAKLLLETLWNEPESVANLVGKGFDLHCQFLLCNLIISGSNVRFVSFDNQDP